MGCKVDLKIKYDVRFIIYIHAMITSLSNTIRAERENVNSVHLLRRSSPKIN